MIDAAVDAIVRAVLYEGFVLYPYRASSTKNRQRFTFGCLYPPPWCRAEQNGDASTMRTEVVVVGERAVLDIDVRFLHPRPGDGDWHEGVERVVSVGVVHLDAMRAAAVFRFAFDDELRGEVAVSCVARDGGARRVAIEIHNLSPWASSGASRAEERSRALSRCLASTHTVVHVERGELVSLTDPPAEVAEIAAACTNKGTWPVMVGDRRKRDTMLSSPIILEDYPSIAPESPNDLYDATEIDEILTLRVLTLTEEEKESARATDPRARAVIDRVTALGPDAIGRLHGRGSDLAAGARVRIRPRARADVMDIALAGMAATVASVERDYEGRLHFAVTIDDDPGKDLGEAGMPGHRFFFGRDELELIA